MPLRPYRQLPRLEGLDYPHAWDEFGPDDELGTINLLTPERIMAALRTASEGRVVNLTLPLNLPSPPMFGRKPYGHVIWASARNNQDDYLDGFYLQSSSQWDGLRHVRAREFGFYGGRQEDEAGAAGTRLGIEHWVEHGIIGRGVLLDVPRYYASAGIDSDPFASEVISADTLRAVAVAQGIGFREGDILLVRTGWMSAYLAASPDERAAAAGRGRWIGLAADEAMAEFLWDNHFAALAADNPAVESGPGDPAIGSLHRRVVPLMGLALGELWTFEALATVAAEVGRWESCVISVPLNIPGAVGSPANAIAVV